MSIPSGPLSSDAAGEGRGPCKCEIRRSQSQTLLCTEKEDSVSFLVELDNRLRYANQQGCDVAIRERFLTVAPPFGLCPPSRRTKTLRPVARQDFLGRLDND